MKRNYFPNESGVPPLRVSVERTVRFEETDQLGIVWHGRYASFFEDARTAFGEKYNLSYPELHKHGIIIPLKQIFFDFERPLRFREHFTVEITLHWSDAARINFSYVITDVAGQMVATGYTVQVMVDIDFNLLFVPPPFLAEFRARWRKGELI
jgi:acyl-CoA thioester hydrolase